MPAALALALALVLALWAPLREAPLPAPWTVGRPAFWATVLEWDADGRRVRTVIVGPSPVPLPPLWEQTLPPAPGVVTRRVSHTIVWPSPPAARPVRTRLVGPVAWLESAG